MSNESGKHSSIADNLYNDGESLFSPIKEEFYRSKSTVSEELPTNDSKEPEPLSEELARLIQKVESNTKEIIDIIDLLNSDKKTRDFIDETELLLGEFNQHLIQCKRNIQQDYANDSNEEKIRRILEEYENKITELSQVLDTIESKRSDFKSEKPVTKKNSLKPEEAEESEESEESEELLSSDKERLKSRNAHDVNKNYQVDNEEIKEKISELETKINDFSVILEDLDSTNCSFTKESSARLKEDLKQDGKTLPKQYLSYLYGLKDGLSSVGATSENTEMLRKSIDMAIYKNYQLSTIIKTIIILLDKKIEAFEEIEAEEKLAKEKFQSELKQAIQDDRALLSDADKAIQDDMDALHTDDVEEKKSNTENRHESLSQKIQHYKEKLKDSNLNSENIKNISSLIHDIEETIEKNRQLLRMVRKLESELANSTRYNDHNLSLADEFSELEGRHTPPLIYEIQGKQSPIMESTRILDLLLFEKTDNPKEKFKAFIALTTYDVESESIESWENTKEGSEITLPHSGNTPLKLILADSEDSILSISVSSIEISQDQHITSSKEPIAQLESAFARTLWAIYQTLKTNNDDEAIDYIETATLSVSKQPGESDAFVQLKKTVLLAQYERLMESLKEANQPHEDFFELDKELKHFYENDYASRKSNIPLDSNKNSYQEWDHLLEIIPLGQPQATSSPKPRR